MVSGAPREVIADAGNTFVKLGADITPLPEKTIKIKRQDWRGGFYIRHTNNPFFLKNDLDKRSLSDTKGHSKLNITCQVAVEDKLN